MVTSSNFDEEDKPLDPAVEKVRRRLVRFVGINLGLLFVALMAVVAAIVYRAGSSGTPADPKNEFAATPPSGEMLTGEVALPVGARVVSQSLSGNRLALTVDLPGEMQAIFLYDIRERRIVGRFDVAAR